MSKVKGFCPCCKGPMVDTDNEFLDVLECTRCGVRMIEGLFEGIILEIVETGANVSQLPVTFGSNRTGKLVFSKVSQHTR